MLRSIPACIRSALISIRAEVTGKVSSSPTCFETIAYQSTYVRAYQFILATLLFLAGSSLATGSGSFSVLLAARCIQGAGGGGLLTLSEILIADLTPLRERGRWIGLLSMMWAIGCVSGPIVGGALADKSMFFLSWVTTWLMLSPRLMEVDLCAQPAHSLYLAGFHLHLPEVQESPISPASPRHWRQTFYSRLDWVRPFHPLCDQLLDPTYLGR